MPYKLLVVDIDGTLVNSHDQLTEPTRQALQRAVASGMRVVLATGLVARDDAVDVARMLGIPYDKYNLFAESHPKLAPVETVTSGVYLTGACQAPKDIPDTVATASAASAREKPCSSAATNASRPKTCNDIQSFSARNRLPSCTPYSLKLWAPSTTEARR